MTTGRDKILDYFNELNAIPRCSGNEAGAHDWLSAWAQQQGYEQESDPRGNLVVRVPATPGFENSPVVVIQGHTDMVCEKTPQSTHDFDRDPIVSHREGEWLTADDTTLGADNGIAIAYALALAEDDDVGHPPLELLFTVDEETGLNGAKGLQTGFLRGRTLINLDSEDEGIVTIGCAGGQDTRLTLELDKAPLDGGELCHRLVVGGLKGGHSGIDIHKQRGNANKLIGRLLGAVATVAPSRLVDLEGGTRKNAIPRDARAVVVLKASDAQRAADAIARCEAELKLEHDVSDAGLSITFAPETEPTATEALTVEATRKVIDLLAALPNGVAHMSPALEGLVETSCNLATVKLQGGRLSLLSSQRSAVMSRLHALTEEVRAIGRICAASMEDCDSYPSWEPDFESPVLARSKKVYQTLYGRDLVVQVIHAGLECAVIGDIYPGTDMISFGPTIRNPHSPDEKIHLPSVNRVWDFLVALFASMKA